MMPCRVVEALKIMSIKSLGEILQNVFYCSHSPLPRLQNVFCFTHTIKPFYLHRVFKVYHINAALLHHWNDLLS